MSPLRKQLQQAKADYESACYPGDLASVVLGVPSRSRSFWRVVRPFLAAAACVAIFVSWNWFNRGKIEILVQAPPATQPAYEIPAVAEMPEPEALPEVPTFPTDMPLVPTESYSSFPSMPSVPSMPSINSSTDTSTSEKEPV